MVSDSEPELVTQIETLYEQDFYSLRDECLHNNFMFEDPEFLPREEFLRERTKEYEDIVWLRPHDICRPDEPILVSNKNEGFDVKQVSQSIRLSVIDPKFNQIFSRVWTPGSSPPSVP